jgi:hypothetical protein
VGWASQTRLLSALLSALLSGSISWRLRANVQSFF